MNLKIKAALDVVGMIAVATVASGTTLFILENVPLRTIGYVAGAVFFGYMLYLMYSIRLSQLEYRTKLKEMVDSK